MVDPTISLKIYAHAINLLHDPNWTGCTLYDELKQWYRGRREPYNLFHKIIKDGVLFQIGKIFFDDYILAENYIEKLDDEYKCWYLEDSIKFYQLHWPNESISIVQNIRNKLNKVYDLFEVSEKEYYTYLNSEDFFRFTINTYRDFINMSNDNIGNVKLFYADAFANRAFHDLQLCSYISYLIRQIGIDGTIDDEEPEQWVKRTKIPKWAEIAILSRENGMCACCKKDLAGEFIAPRAIDHIVPLSHGGINDIVNLQLLCGICNSRKQAREQEFLSSIPLYMQSRLDKLNM